MPPNRQRLFQLLFETAFLASPTPRYPLSSGIVSPYYIDCRRALSYPEVRRLVGELLFERIPPLPVEAIGGLALGAYPLAIAISDAAYAKGVLLRVFVIRSEPKAHGLKKVLEGEVRKGDRVVIVDDVITTGRSAIEAILKSREEGLTVVKALALVDRQEAGGRECIESYGIPFEALFTLQDFTGRLGQP